MMRMLRHVWASLRRGRLDDRIREELDHHIAWKAAELEADGVAPDEARRRAAVAVGNTARLREDSRAVWGFPAFDSVAQDVRYGLRQMRHAPTFTAVAVLSLAIGIAASAAVFSLADAIVFRKLPVADPDALVVFKWSSGPVFPFRNLNGYSEQNDDGLASTSFSAAAYQAFAEGSGRYLDVAGFADIYGVNLAVDGRADTGNAHLVDGRFFGVLGVRAAAGRTLQPADDRRDAPAAAVISHAYWMRRFGGAADAVGRTIAVNAAPFVIAGVMPAGFRGTGQVGTNPDVYVPIAHRALVLPGDDDATDPNYWWVLAIGRLKPGIAADEARGALDVLLKRTVAAAQPQLTAKDLPALRLLPGAHGQVEERASMRAMIATMGWVTIVVLLVACANVAGLLLAKGRARLRELSVRVAIGASRTRVIRQMFTEAVVLAAAGSALGIVLARWIARALMPALATGPDPVMTELALDTRFLLFVAGIASTATIVFGLLPALRSTSFTLAAGLEETRRGLTGTRERRLLSGGLVAMQIALSLPLLTGAGLLVRSVRNLERSPLGFEPRNVLLFQIDPGRNSYDNARALQLKASVLDRVRAIPGVVAATLSNHRLISNSSSITAAMRLDEVQPPRGSAASRAFAREHLAYVIAVDGDFFSTLGLPLIRGQTFTGLDSGAERVAVVNRSMALRLFGTEDAVGRQFRFTFGSTPHRIVGVCADGRVASLRRPIEPTAYTSYRQMLSSNATTFEVKTSGPPSALASTIVDVVRAHDPMLPVSRIGTQEEQIAASIATERMFARLASALGVLALALSSIGLYGLLAYAVVQRTAEIGVRVALGAAPRTVRWMVLRQSLLLAALGVAVGVGGAFAGSQLLSSLLYGLPPRDPLTMTVAAAVMLGTALIAAYLPARHAARVDPLVALRAD